MQNFLSTEDMVNVYSEADSHKKLKESVSGVIASCDHDRQPVVNLTTLVAV